MADIVTPRPLGSLAGVGAGAEALAEGAPADQPSEIEVVDGPSPADRRRDRPARAVVGGPELVVVPTLDGPHGRLGVAWFLPTVAVTLAGPAWLAAWLAAAAAFAAWPLAAAVGISRRSAQRPVIVAGAAALPLAALQGVEGLTLALVLLTAVALVARLERRQPDPAEVAAAAQAVGGAVVVGLAASAPVLAAGWGLGPALGLLVLVSAHDAGTYIVGVGSGHKWEGPAAGVAATAVVGFGLAVLNVFGVGSETSWLLVVVAAALFPLGPAVATLLVGQSRTPVPGLRRLDSLIVAGPILVWLLSALR